MKLCGPEKITPLSVSVSTSEMTEEEMMALALHLSAQEANVGAQQEDAALKKAIKESVSRVKEKLPGGL